MNKKTKFNYRYNYTLIIGENDMVDLKVYTEDDVLEFDGIKGNLMDGSDFESHFDDEEHEMTLEEMLHYSVEFLTDWGVDEETAKAITEELTEWFKRYAIEEPKADAWLKVLEGRVEDLELEKALYRDEVNAKARRFKEWVAEADEFDVICDAESKAHQLIVAKDELHEICNKLRKANAELWNYKEAMHIR